MAKFKFELPFEPYDRVYYVNEEGIYSLIVTQIQIVKYEKTHVFTCFPNFPFVALEEYGVNLFTDLGKAEERLKQIRRREEIKKIQEIMKKKIKKDLTKDKKYVKIIIVTNEVKKITLLS